MDAVTRCCTVRPAPDGRMRIDQMPALRAYFGPDMFKEPEAFARWISERGGE